MSLENADLTLAKTDRALAGLETILDADSLVSRLTDLSLSPLGGQPSRRYIRYKPGTNCIVAYSVDTKKQSSSLYAKAFSADFDVKRQKAATKLLLAPGAKTQLWVIPEEKILVRRFPGDGKLKSLTPLVGEYSRRPFMKQVLPDNPEFWDATITELAYKPERRYVCRIQGAFGYRAVLKLYNRTAYHRSLANSRFLRESGHSFVPARIGNSDKHLAIIYRWHPGHNLRETAQANDGLEKYSRQAGYLLAEFHKSKAGASIRRWNAAEETRNIRRHAKTLRFLLPDCDDLVNELATRLTECLVRKSFSHQLIHGDFHAKQILLYQGSVRFLDVDDLASGPVELDLGTFLAHVHHDVHRNFLAPTMAKRISCGFLNGYARNGGLANNVDLYTALALFKRSHHPFRTCDPNWKSGIRQILRQASILLDGTGVRSKPRILDLLQ